MSLYPLSLCVCLSICLSVCLSVCLCLCLPLLLVSHSSPDKTRANSYSAPGQFTSCVILTHPPSHSPSLTPSPPHIWRWRYRNLISLSHGHCTHTFIHEAYNHPLPPSLPPFLPPLAADSVAPPPQKLPPLSSRGREQTEQKVEKKKKKEKV